MSHHGVQASQAGAPIAIDGAQVRTGTCSWTDPTLVRQADWYPRKSMTAAERLEFYAGKFPAVEVDSTYYFPPTPELARMWVERTPPGFAMNVKAYSLLTGHPTFPHSLWPDLQAEVLPEFRDKRRLYAKHLPDDAVDEVWDRFVHALKPLHTAGKLGAVLVQFPRWFGPKDANREQLAAVAARLGEYRGCVELRNGRWLEAEECEATMALLEDLHLAYVCVDEPQGFRSSVPPVVAVTSDLAVVRFHGRNAETWEDRDVPSAAERFRYRYRVNELQEWVPKVHELAASARDVHLLMNNCYRDNAVVNAAQLAELLQGREPDPDPGPPPAPYSQQRLRL
ncbi:MAG: DUF72 domain-containing protein [Acidimicrobiales bacterium]